MATGQIVTVKFNIESVIKQLGYEMTPRLLRAGVRAANRTADSERTVFARDIAKDLSLKVGVTKEQLRVSRATDSRPSAYLVATGKRIPVIDIGARGSEPSRGKGRGVTAKTRARRYPHAFIATMKSGHRGVFERAPGAKRLKIFEVTVASIGHVFGKLIDAPPAPQRRSTKLLKEVQHQIEFALRGA